PSVGVFPLASAVLRRHTPAVARFNEIWWAEICRWSRRGPPRLPPPAVSAGVSWSTFPRQSELERDTRHRHLGSPHFRWFSHGAWPQAAAASPADPLPAWSRARLAFLARVRGERQAYAP